MAPAARGIGIHTYDDLFQIGCVGLCKAADTYKAGKASFSTYAYMLIRLLAEGYTHKEIGQRMGGERHRTTRS